MDLFQNSPDIESKNRKKVINDSDAVQKNSGISYEDTIDDFSDSASISSSTYHVLDLKSSDSNQHQRLYQLAKAYKIKFSQVSLLCQFF